MPIQKIDRTTPTVDANNKPRLGDTASVWSQKENNNLDLQLSNEFAFITPANIGGLVITASTLLATAEAAVTTYAQSLVAPDGRGQTYKYNGLATEGAGAITHIFATNAAGDAVMLENRIANNAAMTTKLDSTPVHITSAQVASPPTVATIKAFTDTLPSTYRNKIIRYTGTLIATDAMTYSFEVDAVGGVTPKFAPDISLTNNDITIAANRTITLAGRTLTVAGTGIANVVFNPNGIVTGVGFDVFCAQFTPAGVVAPAINYTAALAIKINITAAQTGNITLAAPIFPTPVGALVEQEYMLVMDNTSVTARTITFNAAFLSTAGGALPAMAIPAASRRVLKFVAASATQLRLAWDSAAPVITGLVATGRNLSVQSLPLTPANQNFPNAANPSLTPAANISKHIFQMQPLAIVPLWLVGNAATIAMQPSTVAGDTVTINLVNTDTVNARIVTFAAGYHNGITDGFTVTIPANRRLPCVFEVVATGLLSLINAVDVINANSHDNIPFDVLNATLNVATPSIVPIAGRAEYNIVIPLIATIPLWLAANTATVSNVATPKIGSTITFNFTNNDIANGRLFSFGNLYRDNGAQQNPISIPASGFRTMTFRYMAGGIAVKIADSFNAVGTNLRSAYFVKDEATGTGTPFGVATAVAGFTQERVNWDSVAINNTLGISINAGTFTLPAGRFTIKAGIAPVFLEGNNYDWALKQLNGTAFGITLQTRKVGQNVQALAQESERLIVPNINYTVELTAATTFAFGITGGFGTNAYNSNNRINTLQIVEEAAQTVVQQTIIQTPPRILLTETNLSAVLNGVTFSVNLADPMNLTTSVAANGFITSDLYQIAIGQSYSTTLSNGINAAAGQRWQRGNSWNGSTVREIGIYTAAYCCTISGELTIAGARYSIRGSTQNGQSLTILIERIL